MLSQKGFVPILLAILAAAIIGIGGMATAALLGQAPKCPSAAGGSRSEKELGDILDKTGSVTTSDAEATAIAQNYVAGQVNDARACFTPGLAHASGNIQLGPLTPSFYASAGIDLSGSTPKATNLNIKVGSLPNIPVLSSQVGSLVTNLINKNLAKVQLKKKYSIQFQQGSATITKLSQ